MRLETVLAAQAEGPRGWEKPDLWAWGQLQFGNSELQGFRARMVPGSFACAEIQLKPMNCYFVWPRLCWQFHGLEMVQFSALPSEGGVLIPTFKMKVLKSGRAASTKW